MQVIISKRVNIKLGPNIIFSGIYCIDFILGGIRVRHFLILSPLFEGIVTRSTIMVSRKLVKLIRIWGSRNTSTL